MIPALSSGFESPRSAAILDRLLVLHPKKIDLVLDRMLRLLGALGNPQLKLPPVIHVAGTNGKGSACAFSRAILEAQGLKVHMHISPHLVRFHERIRIAGELISEDELCAVLEEVERVNDGEPITFFEITGAAMFLAFSRHPADAVVLEVGLGGTYDATNVVPRPAMTIIQPVGLDHVEFLGNDIATIAGEKAGIIKPGVPVVVGPQDEIAREVILRRADTVSAPAFVFGQDFFGRQEHGRMVYEDEMGLLDLPLPRLIGQAPEGAEIWLDGGHNPHCAAAVSRAIADLDEKVDRPLYLICAMLRTKDAEGFLSAFKGLARHVVTVSIPGEAASLGAGALYDAARAAGLDAAPAEDLEDAMLQVGAWARAHPKEPPPRILICGSLYLAGHILRENS
jgi:dihydrofolate synthase/folylpolyglutamate synthase